MSAPLLLGSSRGVDTVAICETNPIDGLLHLQSATLLLRRGLVIPVVDGSMNDTKALQPAYSVQGRALWIVDVECSEELDISATVVGRWQI